MTINRLSWRRWQWLVDDIADRHGSYQGVVGTRSQAVAAADEVVRRLGSPWERRAA